MTTEAVALICIADARLRVLCSILLRHSGYRVKEMTDLDAALVELAEAGVVFLVAGELADPEDRLTPNARERGIPFVRVSPQSSVEAVLELVE